MLQQHTCYYISDALSVGFCDRTFRQSSLAATCRERLVMPIIATAQPPYNALSQVFGPREVRILGGG